MNNLLKDKEFVSGLKKLMIPITFQTLMLNAVSFGDTLMLGLVSQESLAAVSLASQVSFVMSLFISTLTGGATVLSAQYIGKKDMDTVEGVLALILRDALLVSLIFFGLAECCPQLLMRVFTGEAEMIGIGAEYLRIAGVSYLFSGFSQCFLCMLKVNDRAKTGTFITTGVVFLDLFLNAIFIFGLFGFPAMGARGAALTTVLSKGVELIAVAAYFRASGVVRVKGRKLLRPDFSLEQEFWKYSFPIFLNDMAWGGGVTVYSVIIGHLGTDATAANSIVTVVKNLVICISTGMGSASGILVGRVLGENRLSLGKRKKAFPARPAVRFSYGLSGAPVRPVYHRFFQNRRNHAGFSCLDACILRRQLYCALHQRYGDLRHFFGGRRYEI